VPERAGALHFPEAGNRERHAERQYEYPDASGPQILKRCTTDNNHYAKHYKRDPQEHLNA
jgi:hypothetical protein